MKRKPMLWAVLILALLQASVSATTRRWVAAANAEEQLNTIEVTGTWAAGDTFTAEINNKQVVVTMGSGTTTTTAVAAAIAEALVATSHDPDDLTADMEITFGGYEIGEFKEIYTAIDSSNTSQVNVMSVVPGTPYTLAASASTAGTGDVTYTQDVNGVTGPNWFTDADNWSPSGAPASGDVLVWDHGSDDVLYGINNTAVLNLRLYVYNGYTGDIGLPKINASTAALPFSEYRTRYLGVPVEASTGVVQIFCGDQTPVGTTSGRRYFDLGTNTGTTCQAVIYDAGSRGTDGESVQILGGRELIATVNGGTVSFGNLATGNASQFDSLTVVRRSATATAPSVLLGGQTLFNASSTFTNDGGTVTLSAATSNATFQLYGGTTNLLGTGGATACHVRDGATLNPYGGTITNLFVYAGGTVDTTAASAVTTATNATAYPGATITDSKGYLTLTNGLDVVGGGLQDVSVTTKDSLTATFSDL